MPAFFMIHLTFILVSRIYYLKLEEKIHFELQKYLIEYIFFLIKSHKSKSSFLHSLFRFVCTKPITAGVVDCFWTIFYRLQERNTSSCIIPAIIKSIKELRRHREKVPLTCHRSWSYCIFTRNIIIVLVISIPILIGLSKFS